MECHPKTHQRDDQKALSDYVLIPSSHHRPRTFNRNDKRSVGYTGSNIKHTLLILVGRAVTSRTKFRRKTRNNHWHAKYANNNRNFKRSLYRLFFLHRSMQEKNVDARKTRDFANLTQNSSTVILSIYNVVLSFTKTVIRF